MSHEQYRLGRSLNKDWIRGRVIHIPHHYRQQSTENKAKSKNVRAKSVSPLRSASADVFLETSDGEISDTYKEFKLTMQLFKRLTQQVRDVNQCMNQQRIYSFKHHMNNEGIASPALRRSQLAAAMSKREIPATEAPYEPCNDLGPTCASYLTRPCSRHERAISSPVPMSRPSSSASPSRTSSPSPTLRPSSRSSVKRTTDKIPDPKKLQHDLAAADAKARLEWEESDPHFEDLFVPEEISLEDLDFRFHDPYPETWVEETVEDACFRGTKRTDLFMHRLKELENLKEETVLWEIYREEKAKQNGDSASSSKGSSQKFSRLSSGQASNSRTQSAKVSAPQLYRAKSAVNRLRRTSSAGKSSASNHAISASDDGSDSVQTFRNSGYQLGISFVPGSLYPEARPPPKTRTHAQSAKSSSSENNSRKGRNASASANTQTSDIKKASAPKQPPCEACNPRPAVSPRSACTSPRGVATSVHALRSQYALKASECYDIVELARTFDPPCKAHFAKAKAKMANTGVDSALSKGISPGKSYFSQRKVSLTRLTPDENMTVRGVSPQNMARPSTGRCKSAKRGPKRR
ncbi:uncharacterized protein LOC144649962 isoform X2 [Oculina patagonica]